MKRYENCCILRGMGNPPCHARGCRHCKPKETQPMPHTPGPWTCGRVKPIAGVTTVKGWFIAPRDGPTLDIGEVYLAASQDEQTQGANARLIAAAPELLDALLGLLTWECSPASAKATPTKEEAAAYMALIDAATKAIAKTKEKSI